MDCSRTVIPTWGTSYFCVHCRRVMGAEAALCDQCPVLIRKYADTQSYAALAAMMGGE